MLKSFSRIGSALAPAARPALMTAGALGLIVGLFLVYAAWCGLRHDDVPFTFDNRTDSVLCVYSSPQDASASRCLAEVKPQAESRWTPGCAYGSREEVDRSPVTAVLTVKDGGRQIYLRTATCRAWNETDRKLVIEQRGDEFIVTDPFSGSTSP